MALVHSSVGMVAEVAERSWSARDVLLYALSVGAGLGDPTAKPVPPRRSAGLGRPSPVITLRSYGSPRGLAAG